MKTIAYLKYRIFAAAAFVAGLLSRRDAAAIC